MKGRKLDRNLAYKESASLATVGPYTIKGHCLVAPTNVNEPVQPVVKVAISAVGPAGTADAMFDKTEGDSSDRGTESRGLLISANVDTEFASIAAPQAKYRRIGGTAMLRGGARLVQVNFIATANGKAPGPSCFVYGTATTAT